LHPVRVPSTEEEALRDLVRAREDIRGDLMRARHRMSKAACCATTCASTGPRRRGRRTIAGGWAASISATAAPKATLIDYLGAIDALIVRRVTLEHTIDELDHLLAIRSKTRRPAHCNRPIRTPGAHPPRPACGA